MCCAEPRRFLLVGAKTGKKQRGRDDYAVDVEAREWGRCKCKAQGAKQWTKRNAIWGKHEPLWKV